MDDMTADEMRNHWAEYRKTFGGGLVPFDIAYLDALRDGESPAHACLRGADALQAAFIDHLEAKNAFAPATGQPHDP